VQAMMQGEDIKPVKLRVRGLALFLNGSETAVPCNMRLSSNRALLEAELQALDYWDQMSKRGAASALLRKAFADGQTAQDRRRTEVLQELEHVKDHPDVDEGQLGRFEGLGQIGMYSLHFCELAPDLRNMLAVILGHCELLDIDLSTNALAQRRVQAIRKAEHRMSEQIDSARCAAGAS
jgi:hypothetical protein